LTEITENSSEETNDNDEEANNACIQTWFDGSDKNEFGGSSDSFSRSKFIRDGDSINETSSWVFDVENPIVLATEDGGTTNVHSPGTLPLLLERTKQDGRSILPVFQK